ncbi:hemolysin family protein [Thermocrinis sp.]
MEGSSAVIYTELAVFIFLLFLSGFFSSSEVVFFGTNRYLLRKYSESKLYNLVNKLLSKPREVLLSILIGNEVTNVLLSAYGTKVFVSSFGEGGATFSALLISFLIFIFGEVLPKNIVLHFATRLSLIYSIPFYIIHVFFYPLRVLFNTPVRILLPIGDEYEIKDKGKVFWEIFEMGYGKGLFSEEEKKMVEKAISIKETTAKEIMTPRPDLFLLDEEKTVGEVYAEIIERKHSRIPVYFQSPDNITGIVLVKEIVPFEENLNKKLKEFKKEVLIVPEMMTLKDLIVEMRANNSQMAVVVGEHGELAGLVTIGDILKFLFEEFPESWEEDFQQVGKGVYKIYGWVDVETVSRRLGIELPEDYEYDTIGGFVMKNLAKVPEEGDEFEYGGYKFVVDKMEGNRVVSVLVLALEEQRV